MYSIESIKKMVSLMNETICKYSAVDVNDIKLCISSGNRKIGRVMNVSLPPVMTCTNCSECKRFCYDIKACLQYPNTVIDARIRNYVVLMKSRELYFEKIENAISSRRKNKFFRWHVAGDIVDLDYFSRMVEAARLHADFKFWTYTKNYKVVNEYCRKYGRKNIPDNFSVMFSEWDGMPIDNPYGFPVFSVKMQAGNKNHQEAYFDGLYKCPGNCDVCKENGRGCIAGENVYCDEH